MGQWNWDQPGIGIWKVISDHNKGKISIYDENGKLIIEKSGLNKEAIEIIEKNFFDLVANTEDNGSDKKQNTNIYA